MLRLLLFSFMLLAEPLGLFEQRFSSINFERNQWGRSIERPCRIYTALKDGATVNVLRIGSSNLVAFRASKGSKVTVCNSTAAFDEGFEALGAVSQPEHKTTRP